jgi:hypothetical protein
MPDLEDVKPERFICDCGGVGHFFMRLRKTLGRRRRFHLTSLRFYCMDCVCGLPPALLKQVRPVNETEA